MAVRSLILEKKIVKSNFHLQAIVFTLKLYLVKMERQKLRSVLQRKSGATQPSGRVDSGYACAQILCVWEPSDHIVDGKRQLRCKQR